MSDVMPPTMHPTDAALQAIADCLEHSRHAHHVVDRLAQHLIGDQAQPDYHHFRFTQTSPKFDWHNRIKTPTLSFAVYNQTSLKVYVGIGGASATQAAGALAVPPETLIVVPLQLGAVEEVGIDPADQGALAAGDAVVHAWRYSSIQAAFLGKGA